MSDGSIILISWNGTAKCTTEKTFRQEAISSAFLLEVQKNSVDLVVDGVHAFIVDPPHD